MSLRFFLVDDHKIMRQGLLQLIESQPEWEVCGEAGDGREAVEGVVETKPDIVIMDIALPRLNGHEATLQIRKVQPSAKIIALSAYTDASLVGRMIQAGAVAFVPKDSAYEELLTAIEIVQNMQVYISPQIKGFPLREYEHDPEKQSIPRIDLLTPTERIVLQLVASGMQTKNIAQELDCSPLTVNAHRRSILQKLNVSGVAELTRIAILHGLISLK